MRWQKCFFSSLSANKGQPTVDLRIVLGALMVKHIEGLSDEDTIRYIQENVYAQYFVGLRRFQAKPVFAPSLFVEIRKRLGKADSAKLNDLMVKRGKGGGKDTEFGPKINVSMTEGIARVDQADFNAFNEAGPPGPSRGLQSALWLLSGPGTCR